MVFSFTALFDGIKKALEGFQLDLSGFTGFLASFRAFLEQLDNLIKWDED